MNSFKDKLLDILLYPARFFERLTDNKATLYAGIVLVGAIDLLLPDIAAVAKHLFTGKPVNDVYINAILAVLLIVVLGIVDVIFVGVPLFDFFRYIKKKEANVYEQEHKRENEQGYKNEQIAIPIMKRDDREHIANPVKIMKVYIMSHFIIIPISTFVHYVFLRHIVEDSPVWMQNLALVFFMLIFIWSAAIMARGINTLFRFSPLFTKLTFIIVFTWSFLFGMVFDMQIMNWLLELFR